MKLQIWECMKKWKQSYSLKCGRVKERRLGGQGEGSADGGEGTATCAVAMKEDKSDAEQSFPGLTD